MRLLDPRAKHLGGGNRPGAVEHAVTLRGRPPSFDRETYRRRNVVERCVGRLKDSRRVATRYEKLAVHFLAVVHVAMRASYLQAVFG